MSEHWRIIDAEGSSDNHRVYGKWWASKTNVIAVDVCIWDKLSNSGRVFYSRDMTAFVRDGRVDLPKHMISADRLADAEDAWDLLLAVIQAVADTPWKRLATSADSREYCCPESDCPVCTEPIDGGER